MAKVLTDSEMFEIVSNAGNEIECADAYEYFLECLGDLIADHFGGIRGTVDGEDGQFTCAFTVDESVPDNGGVFAKYDTDVTWKDGKEQ